MTLLVHYSTKRDLKASIGQPLRYTETALVGREYTPDGTLTVAHRPRLTGKGREFFARVTMVGGRIAKVE